MERADLLEKLGEILVRDFRVEPAAVREEAHLRADLRLDSLSLVDLMYLVQKDFGFKATAEEFHGVRTVGALADVIARKLAATPAAP